MSRSWHVDSEECVDDAKRTDHIFISNTKRMRTKPLVAGCSLALVLGSLQILPAQAQINGSWTSSFGKMELSSAGNRNYTGTYQDGKAKIHGKKNGNNLTGHWIKNSSSQRCKYAIDGSYYWGTVSLNFNSNNKSFNGNWGFCNDTRSGSWSGSRVLNIMPIMPTIPIPGASILLAPFEPRLSGQYTSNYGTIDWSQGWYGNGNKTIRVSSKRWDPGARKYIVNGTWKHNGTNNYGRFEFFFTSECSFRGLWWHTNTPYQKKDWSGSCN